MDAIQSALIKIAALATACTFIAIATLAISPGNAATIERNDLAATEQHLATDEFEAAAMQERFVGAPDGVDPIVTGPVSIAFAQKRKALKCDTADWPRVPSGCYPD